MNDVNLYFCSTKFTSLYLKLYRLFFYLYEILYENKCMYMLKNKQVTFSPFVVIQIYRYTDNLITRGEKGKAELPARHKKSRRQHICMCESPTPKITMDTKLKTSNYDK